MAVPENLGGLREAGLGVQSRVLQLRDGPDHGIIVLLKRTEKASAEFLNEGRGSVAVKVIRDQRLEGSQALEQAGGLAALGFDLEGTPPDSNLAQHGQFAGAFDETQPGVAGRRTAAF